MDSLVGLLKSNKDFDKAVKENSFIVIDFYAEWCGPCTMIAPKFENLAKEFTGIKFFKVDVDENEETSELLNISAMPTFKFFKDGEVVDELVGSSEEKLKAKLESLQKK